MTNRIEVGNRSLKPGDRVVQSRSIQYMAPTGGKAGYPWKVVEIWDFGEMAKLEWVGYDDTESGEYAHAVSTRYLVKMEDLPETEEVTLARI
jgi:hypothetical protein